MAHSTTQGKCFRPPWWSPRGRPPRRVAPAAAGSLARHSGSWHGRPRQSPAHARLAPVVAETLGSQGGRARARAAAGTAGTFGSLGRSPPTAMLDAAGQGGLGPGRGAFSLGSGGFSPLSVHTATGHRNRTGLQKTRQTEASRVGGHGMRPAGPSALTVERPGGSTRGKPVPSPGRAPAPCWLGRRHSGPPPSTRGRLPFSTGPRGLSR